MISNEPILSLERPRSSGFTAEILSEQKIVTRENDLNELATLLSAAITKASRLDLPTSAYILSMALLEVSQAMKLAAGDEQDEARR